MHVTYYGHSCFAVTIAGSTLLFDPFITPNPIAQNVETALDLEIIKADYIFITHGHEDHLADAETLLRQTGAMLIANFEIVTWFQEKGFENSHPVNHGGTVKLPFGTAKFVNAIHSSVLPDGSYGGNPGGFVIESDETSFYCSGDTALTYDMKILGEFHQLDWAALCVGDNFTMGYQDAAICAEWVGVKRVLGTHFDTFPMIEIDHDAARAAFDSRGATLYLPQVGETVNISPIEPQHSS